MSEANSVEPLRAVLLDAAGTLIEPRESVGITYSRFAEPYGASLPAWRLDDAFVRVMGHAPPRVFPGAARDDIEREEIAWWRAIVRSSFLAADSTVKFSDFDTFYSELFDYFSTSEAWGLRPGVSEALALLRERGLATGVVSNFDHRLPKILQALDLQCFLDLVVIPADCGFEKPDPRIFGFACEKLGLEPAQVVHVGDDAVRDARAAEEAGLRSLLVGDFESLGDLVHSITAG
ncbi:MAG: HAD-IA family hydrolase [Myxococcota bacterium]|nr:HAD-IA family hydrolase [Myxococcota bacterium]